MGSLLFLVDGVTTLRNQLKMCPLSFNNRVIEILRIVQTIRTALLTNKSYPDFGAINSNPCSINIPICIRQRSVVGMGKRPMPSREKLKTFSYDKI